MQLIFVCRFCILKLYWIHLLLLTVFFFFLVESLYFSMYNIMSYKNRHNFTSFFSICKLFSHFLDISVARTFSTLLKRISKSGHPCLVPDLREKACNFSLLCIILAVGLLYMAFIVWGTFLLYLFCWEFLS